MTNNCRLSSNLGGITAVGVIREGFTEEAGTPDRPSEMGMFKEHGKVGTDIPEGRNGMCEGPEAGLVSVYRRDTESYIYFSSFHSLIHVLTHPFIQLIFLEPLPFARHCAWG